MKKTISLLDKYVYRNHFMGLLISLLCVLFVQIFISFQPFDDAFITYRYARNISNGLGFVYNHGEKVLGTTTPLFTLLLSLIAFLTRPEYIPEASNIISIISDSINVWLIFCLIDSLFKSKWVAFLTSFVFLLQPFRLIVSNGGMETSLFITSLLFTYYLYIVRNRSLSTPIISALAFLIRPDAILALIPIYLDWLFQDRRSFFKAVLITFLIVTPFLVWSTFYFGLPIPQSIIAKSISYKNPLGHAAFFLLTFFGTGTQGPYSSPFILLPIIFFGFPILFLGPTLLLKHQPKALIVGSYPIIYSIVMILINPSMIFSWYFVPLIPGILVLSMGLIWYGPFVENKSKEILLLILSLVMILVPFYFLKKQPSSLVSRSREASFWNACIHLLDHDLVNTSVLAPDIGVIGWCLEDVKILDPIGLVSPESLPYYKNLPTNQYVSLELLKDQQPDYIISLDHYIFPEMINSNFFQEHYELIYEYDVTIAGNNHSLFIFQIIL